MITNDAAFFAPALRDFSRSARCLSVTPRPVATIRAALLAACWLPFALVSFAADGAKKSFDVPLGAASSTLKLFASQAGGHLLYSADAVDGVTTNAVKGDFEPRDALDQMLDGTRLISR